MKNTYLLLFLLFCMTSILNAGDFDSLNLPDPETTVSPGISRSLIMIDVRVTDKKGNPVQGLKAEDFKLYQDGRQQKITEFHEIGPEKNGAEPRIIIFIIDDLGLKQKKYDQIRMAIRHFTDNVMQSTDIVALARTAGGGIVFQPLTSDTTEIRASIDRWQWSVGAEKPKNNSVNSRALFSIKDTRPLSAVSSIMSGLVVIPGRKAVILFSNNSPEMMFYHLMPMNQISKAFVNIYQCALPKWNRNWKDLVENTGGYAIKATTDSFQEIEQVLDDYGQCYLLGYKPDEITLNFNYQKSVTRQGANTVISITSDSKIHSLKIKMNRGGMKVRTKAGFSNDSLAPQTNPIPDQASDVMFKSRLSSSSFLSGNLKVTAEAFPFFSPEKKNIVRITLRVDGENLAFGSKTEDGNRIAEADVTGTMTLESFIDTHRGQARFIAPIEGFEEQRKRAFNTSFEIQVPGPGLYNLRATVLQRIAGRFGNVSILVEVPDFERS
jgi:VWFA-related protein